MQETQIQSLAWEDPMETERATHSSILAWRIPWRIPWTEESGGLYSPWGHKESDTTERLHFHFSEGFPGGSEVKASACNAGDLGSIPG